MKRWVTQFKAICIADGELKEYAGPIVRGFSKADVQEWCHRNASHLEVVGELVMEINRHGTIDYEKISMN